MNYEEFIKNNVARNAREDLNNYNSIENIINKSKLKPEDKKVILDLFSALQYWITYSQSAEESLREERFNSIDLQEQIEDLSIKTNEMKIIIKTMVSFLSNCEGKCPNSESLKKIEFMSELVESHIPME